ncbi:MAG TPA: beta-propeller fold lactonase family protein [Candidatus Angelobacter sp.]|nr:beta-propeller fold lactonase family protein [Candidatus Angelobacter sp.]
MKNTSFALVVAASIALIFSGVPLRADNRKAQNRSSSDPEVLPTGMSITPSAAKGSVFQPLNPDLPDLPQFTADHPVTTAVSPDGNTLLVLTSGYNRNRDAHGRSAASQSNEYLFVFDIRGDIRVKQPVKKQVLQIPNTFVGLAWNPDGKRFYVSGGLNDNVHTFGLEGDRWKESSQPIALGHEAGLGFQMRPQVAGVAVNKSGTLLLAVNYENDSVSIVDLKSWSKVGELDLRPGKNNPQQHGVAGGGFPYWVVFKGDDKAYISCLRDREIVTVDFRSAPAISGRIKIQGQPNKMILNKTESLLFAAADNSDSVSIITTSNDKVAATIKTTAPESVFPNKGTFKGSNPNSLALSPDEHTLYVTNGGTNSVAVIGIARDLDDSHVDGLIPTGWYPNSISLNHDGSVLFVVNGKSNAGPNPKNCRDKLSGETECGAKNQYILQLVKGGFLTLPRPDKAELKQLTEQVAKNNHFLAQQNTSSADPIFAFLRTKIKHVIYVVKENRTYDQVLGDLEKGNGDPTIALFKDPITPNHHDLARRFVTLDNFFDSGEVSGNGWNWSVAARATDNVEKTIAMHYAGRGFSYDFEGGNRNVNVSVPSKEERISFDPRYASLPDLDDQLPGTADVDAPDGPDSEVGAGYLWSSVLRAGLKMRNYGFFLDLSRYDVKDPAVAIPALHDPAASKTRVAFPTHPELHAVTDPYFRGFDQKFPDYWRFKEWEREFDEFVKNGDLPTFELFRIDHDHFGDFGSAIDGINTVETEMADNDYALGLLAEKIAHSPYGADTLIFVLEDDAQNGPDHVDAHRSIAYVIGPYVKQGAVVSNRFNTVSMLRTIEEVLGIKPLGLNDALQPAMAEVFSKDQASWSYTAHIPKVLRTTQLPLPPDNNKTGATTPSSAPLHDAAYWESQTKGFDFSSEDKLDSALFNQVLWKGLMGESQAYPEDRSGLDLRKNRKKLLDQFRQEHP